MRCARFGLVAPCLWGLACSLASQAALAQAPDWRSARIVLKAQPQGDAEVSIRYRLAQTDQALDLRAIVFPGQRLQGIEARSAKGDRLELRRVDGGNSVEIQLPGELASPEFELRYRAAAAEGRVPLFAVPLAGSASSQPLEIEVRLPDSAAYVGGFPRADCQEGVCSHRLAHFPGFMLLPRSDPGATWSLGLEEATNLAILALALGGSLAWWRLNRKGTESRPPDSAQG